jgi:hypothetical protein
MGKTLTMKDHAGSRPLQFGLRTLIGGALLIALATGFAVQQFRLTELQRSARKDDSGPILLFRDHSAPGRIGAWMGGRYVLFDGEARILTRQGTLTARDENGQLVVDLPARSVACNTLIVDLESGHTTIDDPQFFERLGLDLDLD